MGESQLGGCLRIININLSTYKPKILGINNLIELKFDRMNYYFNTPTLSHLEFFKSNNLNALYVFWTRKTFF